MEITLILAVAFPIITYFILVALLGKWGGGVFSLLHSIGQRND